MSNTISWMGNRVLDTGVSRQAYAPVASSVTQQTNHAAPALRIREDNQPLDNLTQQGPPPSTEVGFIPYYLTQNIGKNVRAEFIIGTNMFTDRTGVLKEVGANYFVLYDVNSRADIMCDMYSVKFVTVLQYSP